MESRRKRTRNTLSLFIFVLYFHPPLTILISTTTTTITSTVCAIHLLQDRMVAAGNIISKLNYGLFAGFISALKCINRVYSNTLFRGMINTKTFVRILIKSRLFFFFISLYIYMYIYKLLLNNSILIIFLLSPFHLTLHFIISLSLSIFFFLND